MKTLFFRPLPYNYYYPPRNLSSLTLAILPLTSLRARNTFRVKASLFEQAEITTTLGIVQISPNISTPFFGVEKSAFPPGF
jgi:hypothetical protein